MNVEKRTAATLAQKPYRVVLGGRVFHFRPMSLSDREEISAMVSTVRASVGEDMADGELMAEAVRCGKYARQVAEVIATGAHIRGFLAPFLRWRVYRRAYRDASTEELMLCVNSILDHTEPAFFLGIIISLSRQNTLKPTKETGATAPG
jgi:hypothetical protein